MDEPKGDFLSTAAGTLVAWGIPGLAMVAMIGVPHPAKTWVWAVALVWMGGACLWNARRCGRRHCAWTGPFFLIMALLVVAYGYGFLPLGGEGWKLLGLAIGVGAFALIKLTERNGKYS